MRSLCLNLYRHTTTMSATHNCFAGVWEVDPRKRVRIAIGDSRESLRCVLWVEFGKDGSIYFGPRNPKYAYVKAAAKQTKDRELFISYDEGEPISNEPMENVNKMSFHASGVITSFGRRSIRSALRDISTRELLCHFLPEKLSNFPLLEAPRKFDIALKFPFVEQHPIICSVYVAPMAKALPPVEVKDAPFQCSVLLTCNTIKEVQPLCVQLLFSQKVGNEWPPYTYIVWPVKEHDFQ